MARGRGEHESGLMEGGVADNLGPEVVPMSGNHEPEQADDLHDLHDLYDPYEQEPLEEERAASRALSLEETRAGFMLLDL